MPDQSKPLNVASSASEAIGKELSNFAVRRFTFHGKRYLSVEGWYQGLKWPDPRERAVIAKLAGRDAKRAGKGAPPADSFLYEEKEYHFGSAEHHQLVKQAIRASLEQNPEILSAFLQTYPRPFTHETGRPDKPGSALPGAKFVQLLEELRSEFLKSSAPSSPGVDREAP